MYSHPSAIGPYTIDRELGRGGMGVVYLGRDTKLDRPIAIKALPEHFASDPDRLARFEREARTLASLSHPNIAGIYGLEEHDGAKYLILEYVEGETLADRLDRGALPVDEALEIAAQIAAGVEAAHEQGIIHRDLKPGNVIVTPEGDAKVLDFGLARVEETSSSSMGGMSESPTLSTPAIQHSPTIPGAILGTAAYMSPEQARGRRVDKRTDIWSFGVVLYEMLTGASPFHGETASDSIGAVLHKQLDWSALPANTPEGVKVLLRRCLMSDISKRKQSIGDVRIDLEEVARSDDVSALIKQPMNFRVATLVLCVFCAALLVVLIMSFNSRQEASKSQPPLDEVRSVVTLPDGMYITWLGNSSSWGKIGYSRLVAISPDGRRVIMTVQHGLHSSFFMKDGDEFSPREVKGTTDARGAFFSPDGQWIGFVAEGALQKIRLPGGTPEKICNVNSTAFDATWKSNGTIVYSTDYGLMSVSADGGEPRQLTTVNIDVGERGHIFPNAIEDTPFVLFTLVSESGSHAAILSLEDGAWEIIKRDATDA